MRYFSLQDKQFMARALEQARRGLGATSPNPPVGAVIVKGGEIIGEGYHEQFGAPHAEVNALRSAGEKAVGGTLYVSLEPCSTHGKTPPCVETIVQAGIERIVIGCLDPNPLNKGKGVEYLESKGVTVAVGALEPEARKLTEAFEKYITKSIPYFTVKVAMSLDGKIATAAGESRWISGEDSRELAHQLRATVDAILVGVTTVECDDPSLTVRVEGLERREPLRVVLDSRGQIPLDARILSPQLASSTVIAVIAEAAEESINKIEDTGAQVIRCGERNGRVDVGQLAVELAKMGIVHVLVEGGGEVIASCFNEKLVDKVAFFIAGKLIGGRAAPSPVGGKGIEDLSQAITVVDMHWRKSGEDLLIEGYVRYPDNEATSE